MGEFSGKFPVRMNVAVMLFLACMISYMLRVNFSIALLAMVNPTTIKSIGMMNDSTIDGTPSLPDYGPRYDWSKTQQGLLLGAFFWGYLISSLPGTVLAERFGGKVITTWILGLSTVITALMPVAASMGFYTMYAARFITGFLSGPQYPALHNLVAKWAPPEEKGKFISALMGGTFGTVVTFPIAGLLIEAIGWDFAFYVPAALTGVVGILWYFIVSDSPRTHPWIKPKETEFIEKALGSSMTKERPKAPIKAILTSVPFIALTVLHYGNLWGMFFLMTAAPKFMNEVLNFNLSSAGFLSALPYLARLSCGFLFGTIGDFIRMRQWLSSTGIRKTFTIFSHILPGVCLIVICFVYDPYISVAIITTSLAFNGAATITNLQNSHDLAPNFAGLLYGIMNFVGTTSGFISPAIVAYFTQTGNTMDEWSKIFYIGSVVYIVTAIVFMIFGSGNIQPWNEPKKPEEQPEKGQNTRL
ncbi:sialin [Sergentomyia squamirostris]